MYNLQSVTFLHDSWLEAKWLNHENPRQIQTHYASFEEESLNVAKCETLVSAFNSRSRRLNGESKVSIEGWAEIDSWLLVHCIILLYWCFPRSWILQSEFCFYLKGLNVLLNVPVNLIQWSNNYHGLPMMMQTAMQDIFMITCKSGNTLDVLTYEGLMNE